jgi:cyclophilin family peptidyl-prolyl cis-trans isomerase
MRRLVLGWCALLGMVTIGAVRGATAQAAPDRQAILKDPKNPVFSKPAPDVFEAKVETNKGVFVIEVTRAWAPIGADRFYHFAQLGFYDDSRFFRVLPDFVAQFGIPGDTAVAWAWSDQAMPDDSVRIPNTRGTVVFATAGPNSRTSQLFVNLANNTRLDRQGFAPFGQVVQGLEVVATLYSGYGELTGAGAVPGAQDSIFARGNAFLDGKFPKLDKILRVTVTP